MTERPWYAHYENDYLGKTKSFTCAAQHGIYRAIVAALNIDGALPNDDDELRAICRATPEEWAAHWPKIRDKFLELNEDGLWDHPRAADERRKAGKINKRLSNAGKKGAEARWKKKAEGAEKPADELPDDVAQAVALYNEMAERAKLTKAQKISGPRASKIAKRMKEAGGLEGWKTALEKVERSDFCKGKNREGWRADLDFMCQASSFTKIMEGRYDNKKPTGQPGQGPIDHDARRAEIVAGLGAARMDTRRPNPDDDNPFGS